MNFQLTEEQVMVQDMVREMAQKEILPKIMEYDEKQEFPMGLDIHFL